MIKLGHNLAEGSVKREYMPFEFLLKLPYNALFALCWARRSLEGLRYEVSPMPLQWR